MCPADSPPLERTLNLPDLAATVRLARAMAGAAQAGDIIALAGDLGAGKTTFARAFINGLPGPDNAIFDEEVPSPTFTLVQTYERRPAPVWHFDLYRIEQAEEAYELGIEEAFAEAISLIEWPERLGRLLPETALRLTLSFLDDPGARQARLAGSGAASQRLMSALPLPSAVTP